MSRRWKRNTVVATMAVLVCAAVALNWRYAGEAAGEAVRETGNSKLLGEATLVSGQETDGGEEAPGDEESVYTGSDYFASARLTRQQARDNAISLLQEAAEPTPPRPMRPARASRSWRPAPSKRLRSKIWSPPRAIRTAWPLWGRTVSAWWSPRPPGS